MEKIKEINDFADFILKKLEDKTLQDGINHLVQKGKPYNFLEKEDNIYTVEDLKVRYKGQRETLFSSPSRLQIYQD
ncbi:MAG: hypothetical protein ABJH01_12985 [Algoriphagus sp.]|uniref:hypothetical protein n=1 Tax=Algoriphagus sp. TaxID=1872435 RepID=UPI0032972E3D